MSKMATRQWMVTHEWMVKPMHQREYIEKRGLLIWIAETFTTLGTGLFLVSLFLNNWWGLLVGWLIVLFLKLPIHIAYLGQPLRFYRLFPPFSNAWKTSWFARGILFAFFFVGFGFLQLLVGFPAVADWVGPAAVPLYTVFGIIAGIFALGLGVYGAFMMNVCKGIPFWNQGLLPIVFILAGVADGFGLIIGIGMAGGDASVVSIAEAGTRIFLLVNIFLIIVYLISAGYTSAVAKISVQELLVGHVAWIFWLGIVVLGILIPGVISLVGIFGQGVVSDSLLITAIVSHTIGAFALKYCLLKVGIYRPLFPRVAAY
jgi:formate-dependent nitrite reductase membrane component NrfD